MLKYIKHIALLTAFVMLCGCARNTSSENVRTSTAETADTIEAPQTAEIQSPAGESLPEDVTPASAEAQPEQTEPPAQDGVNLVSGGNSQYSDIFELNGTWCDVGELPFNVVSYEIPLLKQLDQYDSLLGVSSGKLYHIKYSGSQDGLLAYDLTTGEDKLICDISDLGTSSVWFVNDQYLVTEAEGEGGSHLIVTDLQKDKVAFDTPIESGNIMFDPAGGVQIVYDMMYLTAKYTLPEFNRTWDIGITVELNTGEIGLYGYGFSQVSYGVGNVCFADSDRIESILGISTPRYGENVGDDNTYIWYNMFDTYYMTYTADRSYDVLGSRTELFWTDRNNTDHRLGQTSFSVNTTSDQFFMNRDSIFTARLSKITNIQINGNSRNEIKNWLIVGKYDVNADSAQASLIELDGSLQKIYVINDCIYILDFGNGRVTMLYA